MPKRRVRLLFNFELNSTLSQIICQSLIMIKILHSNIFVMLYFLISPKTGSKTLFLPSFISVALSPPAGGLQKLHPSAGIPGWWSALRVWHLRLRPPVCLPGKSVRPRFPRWRVWSIIAGHTNKTHGGSRVWIYTAGFAATKKRPVCETKSKGEAESVAHSHDKWCFINMQSI